MLACEPLALPEASTMLRLLLLSTALVALASSATAASQPAPSPKPPRPAEFPYTTRCNNSLAGSPWRARLVSHENRGDDTYTTLVIYHDVASWLAANGNNINNTATINGTGITNGSGANSTSSGADNSTSSAGNSTSNVGGDLGDGSADNSGGSTLPGDAEGTEEPQGPPAQPELPPGKYILARLEIDMVEMERTSYLRGTFRNAVLNGTRTIGGMSFDQVRPVVKFPGLGLALSDVPPEGIRLTFIIKEGWSLNDLCGGPCRFAMFGSGHLAGTCATGSLGWRALYSGGGSEWGGWGAGFGSSNTSTSSTGKTKLRPNKLPQPGRKLRL